ncbi:MAG: PDC sensor domain-containing protein [Dehalococcoidia bacterium]
MKRILSLVLFFVIIISVVVTAAGCAGPVKNIKQMKSATENLQSIIQSRLLNLDNAVEDAAEKIAKSGLQGEETRGILNGLCRKYPYLTDCSTSDTQGRMITVAPEAYRRYEGTETATTDASRQFFADFAQNRKPMLSNVFRAVEGIDAVVLVRPVISENGELLGMVSALFKPGDLLDSTIAPAAEVRAMKVNVAQTDGLTIYCSNGLETGRNLLTDPRYVNYPELEAMGKKMVAQQTGSAEYTYTSDATGQPVKKTAVWTTIVLHGTEWRLVSIAELGN